MEPSVDERKETARTISDQDRCLDATDGQRETATQHQRPFPTMSDAPRCTLVPRSHCPLQTQKRLSSTGCLTPTTRVVNGLLPERGTGGETSFWSGRSETDCPWFLLTNASGSGHRHTVGSSTGRCPQPQNRLGDTERFRILSPPAELWLTELMTGRF